MPTLLAQLQSSDRIVNQLQQNIGQILNPISANPIVNGILKTNVALVVGSNLVEHGLNRAYQGWIVTGMHGAFTQLFDTPSSQPNLFLTLDSSVAPAVDLYIF